MPELERKAQLWEDKLLDLSKRNKMLHYKETKRSNIGLLEPSFEELFQRIVINEEEMTFKRPVDKDSDIRTFSFLSLMESLSCPIPVSIGDIKTSGSLIERQKTLQNMRAKNRLAMEEQGISILYLIAGFIEWRDRQNGSDNWVKSPLVLVPVSIKLESARAPFTLSRYDDDIVVNPTLAYLFETQHGITLPTFDPDEDGSISTYLTQIEQSVNHRGWKVLRENSLSLLSFLKINMYKDLKSNRERILSNPVLQAFAGSRGALCNIPNGLNVFKHDNIPPEQCFQVVDADSSQQDAVLLSQKGISFVLQGPPGTGKSQTITNIISQALADGKRILFVSEKMAALQVVYRRLEEVKLSDFCLPLHSNKTNKKDILKMLGDTLQLPKTRLHPDALTALGELSIERDKINKYAEDLHTKIAPMQISIYDAYGRLAEVLNSVDITFNIDFIEKLSSNSVQKMQYLVKEYGTILDKMEYSISSNPWIETSVSYLSHDIMYKISKELTEASLLVNPLKNLIDEINDNRILEITTLKELPHIIEIITCGQTVFDLPETWLYENDINHKIDEAQSSSQLTKEYALKKAALHELYEDPFFQLNASEIVINLETSDNILDKYTGQNSTALNEVITLLSNKLKEAETALNMLQALLVNTEAASRQAGVNMPTTFRDIIRFSKLVSDLVQTPDVTEAWFRKQGLQELQRLITEGKNASNRISEKLEKILSIGKKEIIHLPADDLLMQLNSHKNAVAWIDSSSDHSQPLDNDFILKYSNIMLKDNAEISATYKLMLELYHEVGSNFRIPEPVSYYDVNHHITICQAIIKQYQPLPSWSEEKFYNEADKFIEDCRLVCIRTSEIRRSILEAYEPEIFSINYKAIMSRFKTEYTNVFRFLKADYYNDRKCIRGLRRDFAKNVKDDSILSILQMLLEYSRCQEWLSEHDARIKQFIGLHFNGTDTDWSLLSEGISAVRRIKEYIGDSQTTNQLLSLSGHDYLQKIRKYESSLKAIIKANLLCQAAEVINKSSLDSDILVKDSVSLINEYTGQICALSKLLSEVSVYITNQNISYQGLTNLVSDICSMQKDQNWLTTNASKYKLYIPNTFEGVSTKWDIIEESLSCVLRILAYFEGNQLPERIRNFLINKNSDVAFAKMENHKAEQIQLIRELLLNNVLPKGVDASNVYHSIQPLKQIISAYNQLIFQYSLIIKERRVKRTTEEMRKDIKEAAYIQHIANNYSSDNNIYQKRYGQLYKGMDTDWDDVVVRLGNIKQFKELCEQNQISIEFMRQACSSSVLQSQFARFLVITSELSKKRELFLQLGSYFVIDWINMLPVKNVSQKIEKCLQNMSALEVAIDYRNCKEACIETGLKSFIQSIEKLDGAIKDISGAFSKRLYSLWLGLQCEKTPSIARFISRVHINSISNFLNLDKIQLQIAQLRIREMLIKELPDAQSLIFSTDELSILRREIGKRGRWMPLRKLFRQIPNLLLKLKPCLMMSPLSVAHFLEAQTYQFNMVIFDEASQIFPEDAIGAILRGKQVIIAGDSKQLPPTNFFAASSNNLDNSFDTDDEDEYDDIVYDSILEEASNSLPNQPLLWHYRSRHEDLIAFSNRQIYRNELITFPSSINRQPDVGVEYNYVQQGIYEGRCNIREAQRCAMLVFDHIRKHPERSLGIIAFSEKQQNAIEDMVSKIRETSPQYEWFFDENREEPFFVKNLENVQGDERDTIIFSICYGKNHSGTMYMRFGPLGNAGGERRLNVAITRAKHNIKLVGSIQPQDIDLGRTNSEGVKMLRSYIEYAINGSQQISSRPHNMAENTDIFCDHIANYLEQLGYKIKRHVGCSAYKVDIAVVNPEKEEQYIAGIECDGETYIKARTARERDRIRRSMLNEMGWNVYRIWSTDWMRNQQNAQNELKSFLENAINSFSNNATQTQETENEPVQSNILIAPNIYEVTIEKEPKPSIKNNMMLQPYVAASWNETPGLERMDFYQQIKNTILYIVRVEQPIHKELLHRRIAGLFDREKATKFVREHVEYSLNRDLKTDLSFEGDFVLLRGNKSHAPRLVGDRSIDLIAPSEIATVMVDIIKNSFGITPKELSNEVSRLFGFERQGPKISQAMEEVISLLVKQNQIKIIDEKIQLKEA